MKRRGFLKSSAALASMATLQSVSFAADAAGAATPEFYELRLYHLRRGPMQKRFDDFYRDAANPGMNRAGIAPVGVFGVVAGPDTTTMYVLLLHKSMEAFATARDRVQADAEYRKAGAKFLN